MLERLLGLDYRRRRLHAKCTEGPLQDYLATPFPPTRSDCRETTFIALDLETSGLDPQHDTIISFGWVAMRGLAIDLSTARHRVIRQQCAIPESSAVIHQITDDQAATGYELHDILSEFLPILAGHVLIAHNAQIELGFLDTACRRLLGGRFIAPTVDTCYLARRWYDRRNRHFRSGDLRLANVRTRYNLPQYRAHDALSDALSCAELFAAQLAEHGVNGRLPLKAFLLPA